MWKPLALLLMAEALCWNLRRRSEGCTNASSVLIDCWDLKWNEAVEFWRLLFLPARFILLSNRALTVVWGELSGSCFGLMRQVASSFIEVFPGVALCFYCKNFFVNLAVIFWWFVGWLRYNFVLIDWFRMRCFAPWRLELSLLSQWLGGWWRGVVWMAWCPSFRAGLFLLTCQYSMSPWRCQAGRGFFLWFTSLKPLRL